MNFFNRIPSIAALFIAFIVAFKSWVQGFSFSSLCIRVSLSIFIVYALTSILWYYINNMKKKIISNQDKKEKDKQKDNKDNSDTNKDDSGFEGLDLEYLKVNKETDKEN